MYNQFFRFIARSNLSKNPVHPTLFLYSLGLMATAIATIGNSKQDASAPSYSSNLGLFPSAPTSKPAADKTYPKELAFKVASHPW